MKYYTISTGLGVCTTFREKKSNRRHPHKGGAFDKKFNGQAPPSKTRHRPYTCGTGRIVLNMQPKILKELDANPFLRTTSEVEEGCLPTLRLAASQQERSARQKLSKNTALQNNIARREKSGVNNYKNFSHMENRTFNKKRKNFTFLCSLA